MPFKPITTTFRAHPELLLEAFSNAYNTWEQSGDWNSIRNNKDLVAVLDRCSLSGPEGPSYLVWVINYIGQCPENLAAQHGAAILAKNFIEGYLQYQGTYFNQPVLSDTLTFVCNFFQLFNQEYSFDGEDRLFIDLHANVNPPGLLGLKMMEIIEDYKKTQVEAIQIGLGIKREITEAMEPHQSTRR